MRLGHDDKWRRDLLEVVNNLNKNPVFHMGLSSKELFHSNFLCWVASLDHHFPETLFGTWAPLKGEEKGPARVHQEVGHLDLVAYLPNKQPVVIENKLFTSLRRKQLDGYNDKTLESGQTVSDVNRAALTLLGRGDGISQWGWLCHRYDELIQPLTKLAEKHVNGNFNRKLIMKYVEVLELLVRFRDLFDFQSDDEVIYCIEGLPKELNRRWVDRAMKVRYANVANYFSKRTPVSDANEFHFDISRTTPLCEWFFTTDFDGHMVGWQLQGDEVKIAVRILVEGRSQREKYAREHFKGWFASEEVFRSMGRDEFTPDVFKVAKGKFAFHGYEPDFVDKRVVVTGITIGELATIHEYLREKASTTQWT